VGAGRSDCGFGGGGGSGAVLVAWVSAGGPGGTGVAASGSGAGARAAGGGAADEAVAAGPGSGVAGRSANHAPPPTRASTPTAATPSNAGLSPPAFLDDGGDGRTAGLATGRCGGATIVASSSDPRPRPARPVCGVSSASRIARAKLAALGYRSSGRRAIARATTASRLAGAVTEISDGRGGVVLRALWMTAVRPPSNGRSPVSN
jgi:hypothetical protein